MSGNLNRVDLIGRLTRDPEIRRSQAGNPICNINLATNESWRDKTTGERKDKAEFHRIVIFDEKLCEIAEKYLRKGSLAYFSGQIQTRKWTDQSGADKYTTEVVLQQYRGALVMLDGKPESASTPKQEGTPGYTKPEPSPPQDLDDEIPF